MTKQFKLMALASAVFLFGACAEETVLNPEQARDANPESNAITFGTYMGKAGVTRAGYNGSMTTDKLKDVGATTDGFGVFAYYTGTHEYTDFNRFGGSVDNGITNFMYNQQVHWDNSLTDYITKWTYSPIKYWPNEVTNDIGKGVDDQENDANTNPAYAKDYANGGNLSFFAYAPYIPVTQSTANAINGAVPASGAINALKTAEGITAISGNNYAGDPWISYTIAADAKNIVDLLWGTYGGTSLNVNNEGNAGVLGTSTSSAPVSTPSSYAADLLAPYKTNADLTKQKTNGVVGIAFKHALAKIGGSSTTNVPSGVSPVNGLLVKLDIDDQKGAEIGGNREAFTVSTTNDHWRTKVTIKSIEISNDLADGGSGASDITINSTTYSGTTIKNSGRFNLATGKWDVSSGSNSLVEQTIGTTTSSSGTNTIYSAELNKKIAEYKTLDAISPLTATTNVSDYSSDKKGFFAKSLDTTLPGVIETAAQNVFEGDAAPLVFIPGETPVLRFTIDYVVRTYDANLHNEYTEVEQKISKIVSFSNPVELNKQYNILIHLGLTSVKFTATVSDWEVKNDNQDTDVNNDGTVDLEVEDVYLPRNVGGLMLTFSAGNAGTNTFASSATSGSVTISAAKYYVDKTEQTVTPSTLTLTSDPASPSWLTISAPSVTVNAANTTFTDRFASIVASTGQITANPYIIKQYGRTATAIQYTTAAAITDLANTASSSINLTPSVITASGFETAADGGPTSTAVAATDISGETYELVFIDDATHNTAGWITVTGKSIEVAGQAASAPARSATLWVKLNGKLVPVTSDGTHTIQVTQLAG